MLLWIGSSRRWVEVSSTAIEVDARLLALGMLVWTHGQPAWLQLWSKMYRILYHDVVLNLLLFTGARFIHQFGVLSVDGSIQQDIGRCGRR